MNKDKVLNLIGILWAPVGLILLGLVLLFNPDSASALISRVLGWVLIAFGIGFGVSAIVSETGRAGKVIAAVALAVVGGWLTRNPLALAAQGFLTGKAIGQINHIIHCTETNHVKKMSRKRNDFKSFRQAVFCQFFRITWLSQKKLVAELFWRKSAIEIGRF